MYELKKMYDLVSVQNANVRGIHVREHQTVCTEPCPSVL